MSVNNGLINIVVTWDVLKNHLVNKFLNIQYTDDSTAYQVFAVDGNIVYTILIFKGPVPDASFNQIQNDADKIDFENNYKPTSNKVTVGNQNLDGYQAGKVVNLIGGSDGYYSRLFHTDGYGNLNIIGTGVAGTPSGGILSVQGVTGGLPIPISGTITANNLSTGSNNATAPTFSTQIGGTDGYNLQTPYVFDLNTGVGTEYNLGVSLRLPSSSGSVAGGTSSNPIRIDPVGTTSQPVVGQGVDGYVVSGKPVLIAGSDGYNTRTIRTNTDGYVYTVVYNSISDPSIGLVGSTSPLSAQQIAGSDGTSLRAIKVLSDGTVQTKYKELATFTVLTTATATANNKSMISLLNASGSTVVAKIHSIYLVNIQASIVTGVTATFEIRRITNHSSGTNITDIEKMDTNDSLNSSLTVRTNASITGESTKLIWRVLFSTDNWTPNTSDPEATDHDFQTFFPIFKKQSSDEKPLTLRAGEGITIKCTTNTTTGSYDMIIVFTQE